jgi:hypothetical protein
MSYTTTHTHTITEFANPYLRCDVCGQPVEGMIALEGQATTCNHRGELIPCRHLGVTSICPSWSPVVGVGCRCQEHLGYVPHAEDQDQ